MGNEDGHLMDGGWKALFESGVVDECFLQFVVGLRCDCAGVG